MEEAPSMELLAFLAEFENVEDEDYELLVFYGAQDAENGDSGTSETQGSETDE